MCLCSVRTLSCDQSTVRKRDGDVPYSVIVLFSQDGGDLFAIEVLVNVEMPHRVFETAPLFPVHLCCSFLDLRNPSSHCVCFGFGGGMGGLID